MGIDNLIARFERLPGARVGFGPEHPKSPDRSLWPKVNAFFEAYPGLRRDHGYVEFMLKYAGASLADPQRTQLLDIFGFSGVTADILTDLDAPVVDEDGYLMFADATIHSGPDESRDICTYSFAFNLQPDREWNVHVWISTLRTRDASYVPHTDSFESFLAEAVNRGGRFDRPAFD